MISFGETAKARASASICCSPPDRLPARWDGRVPNTGNRSMARSMEVARTVRGSWATAMRRLSVTDSPGKMPRPSGMYVSPSRRIRWAGSPVMSRPSKTTRPAVGATRPDTARAKVLLPAPFTPRTARTDPGTTSDRDAEQRLGRAVTDVESGDLEQGGRHASSSSLRAPGPEAAPGCSAAVRCGGSASPR